MRCGLLSKFFDHLLLKAFAAFSAIAAATTTTKYEDTTHTAGPTVAGDDVLSTVGCGSYQPSAIAANK